MSTFSLFPDDPRIELQVTLDWSKQQITFDWRQIDLDKKLGHGAVWVTGDLLRWRITGGGETDDYCSPIDPVAVEYNLKYLAERFPVAKRDVSVSGRRFNVILNRWERVPIKKIGQTWQFLAGLILEMGRELAGSDSTAISPEPLLDPESAHQAEKRARREEKQRLQREMIQRRVTEANRRNRERQLGATPRPDPKKSEQAPAVTKRILPIPDVEIRIAPARLPIRDLFDVHAGTHSFLQVERASLMWVSNQSDDLLSLPYCAIDHLEYQIRTALRITGSLRGRALLSDEVGLGKTIEAGLVLKEYVTRGLVRRFLVLTVPSLIDQWAEELETKFSLPCVTTNEPEFHADPERFWTKENALIAS
ncbi:MAG TPA: hypothetical protein VE641_01800, partial [Chthoniobacterales bacterium]|nr:hypothetical protein [Chthoniobacterales bacterium]